MSKNKFRYILIGIFTILLILQLVNYDFSADFDWKSVLKLAAPILMIIAMVLSIKHVKSNDEN